MSFSISQNKSCCCQKEDAKSISQNKSCCQKEDDKYGILEGQYRVAIAEAEAAKQAYVDKIAALEGLAMEIKATSNKNEILAKIDAAVNLLQNAVSSIDTYYLLTDEEIDSIGSAEPIPTPEPEPTPEPLETITVYMDAADETIVLTRHAEGDDKGEYLCWIDSSDNLYYTEQVTIGIGDYVYINNGQYIVAGTVQSVSNLTNAEPTNE